MSVNMNSVCVCVFFCDSSVCISGSVSAEIVTVRIRNIVHLIPKIVTSFH